MPYLVLDLPRHIHSHGRITYEVVKHIPMPADYNRASSLTVMEHVRHLSSLIMQGIAWFHIEKTVAKETADAAEETEAKLKGELAEAQIKIERQKSARVVDLAEWKGIK
ncbi:uncharacterized protein LOC119999837 [Tripterygium wilfordii]|uniref:uncharacterized protein LOC119999837 n=1 Tax=Tripterygium wilfordii TaxID=458696 RepID=UPI0018F86265|nr:uncharacterized protein LOC119999837 [Tripterygium wilfordii]